VIFPGYVGNRDVTEESLGYHMGSNLHQASLIMVDEIHRGLCFACRRDKVDRTPEACLGQAQRITADFLRRLPEVRQQLALDAVAAYEGDPSTRRQLDRYIAEERAVSVGLREARCGEQTTSGPR